MSHHREYPAGGYEWSLKELRKEDPEAEEPDPEDLGERD